MPENLEHIGLHLPPVVFNNATELQDVDGLGSPITGGYGGPHPNQNPDHYVNRARFVSSVVDFKATRGSIVGKGLTWTVLLVEYNDDLTSRMIPWPPTSPLVLEFASTSMQIFLNSYHPKKIYFVSTNQDIDPSTYDWGFEYVAP